MRNALIFLWSLAIILGIFTYFIVFDATSGTYGVNPTPSDTIGTMATGTFTGTPGSSSSILAANATSSLLGAGAASGTASTTFFGSAYATPPLSWNDGGAAFSVTAASLQGTQLSLTLSIQIGASPTCVPLDLRLVADESGDLQAPDTPSFSFPDSGNCNGGPGETYNNQTVNFTVNPAGMPLLFTTGGSADIYFEIATTTANGLAVQFPSTSG